MCMCVCMCMCMCACVRLCVNLCVLVSMCVYDVCLCPKSMAWQQQQGPEPRSLSAEPVYHRIPSNAVMPVHPLFDNTARGLSATMPWEWQQQQGPEPRSLSAEPVYHRIPSNAVMSAHPLFDNSARSLSATLPSFSFREAPAGFASSFSSTDSNFSRSFSHESEGLRSPHGMFGSSFSSTSSEVLPPAPLAGPLSRSLALWHTSPRAHL